MTPVLQIRFDDLVDGEATIFHDGHVPVVVTRAGEVVVALEGRCTHQDVPFEGDYLDRTVITCPAHFSEFDALTGAVIEEPATESLRRVSVRIQDGYVLIGGDEDEG